MWEIGTLFGGKQISHYYFIWKKFCEEILKIRWGPKEITNLPIAFVSLTNWLFDWFVCCPSFFDLLAQFFQGVLPR